MLSRRKPITTEAARIRMADLCARSEQCSSDIARKLLQYGLSRSDAHAIVEELKEGKFVDDSRFARAFARDKVRFAGWGPYKIRTALAAKGISSADISAAIGAVEESDMTEAIDRAARARARQVDMASREGRQKLLRHLVGRGFPMDFSTAAIRRLLAHEKED